jgi:hypothetical protein
MANLFFIVESPYYLQVIRLPNIPGVKHTHFSKSRVPKEILRIWRKTLGS